MSVAIWYPAIVYGNLAKLKNYGDLTDVVSANNETPMHIAISCLQIPIFEFLLTEYPQMVTVQTKKGDTVLHYAIRNQCIEIIHTLVMFNADLIDICNEDGNTPLQCALLQRTLLKYGHWPVVALMIAQKPDCLSQKSKNGDTVLHLAIDSKDVTMIRALAALCPSELLTTTNAVHFTPFYNAIVHSLDIVKVHWNSLKFTNNNCQSSLDIVKVLIDADPKAIDIPDADGHLPILLVKDINILKYLLQVCPHAIHHKQRRTNENLLHMACLRDDTEITDMLLGLCPDLLYQKTHVNQSVLQFAFIGKYKDHVNVILRFKPDLVDIDNDGNTVLHMAVESHCELDVVLAVFQNCMSNLYIANANDKTPLCLAVIQKNKYVVEMFQPHMTIDMAVALNETCQEQCGIDLQTYATKRCAMLLNNYLLPDITHSVFEFLGITKKRKRAKEGI